MDPTRNIKFAGCTASSATYRDARASFLALRAAGSWQPAINAFRCENGVRICVDLAGVDKSSIDLTVEPRRVVVRGSREDAGTGQDQTTQILALEIDYGPFEREVQSARRSRCRTRALRNKRTVCSGFICP